MIRRVLAYLIPQKKTHIRVDMHSHIIPNFDDGSKSLEESLAIIQTLISLGYEKIITTPHVRKHIYEFNSSEILEVLESLKKALEHENIDIELEVAAEYYLDEGLLKKVSENDILTIGGKYLLFETSLFASPLYLLEAIYEMKLQGYIPILAHPERYHYIKNHKKTFSELKEEGVLFQLDINSLGGYYGKRSKKIAHLLAKWRMIDFVGSDLHNSKQASYLSTIIASNYYQKILQTNPIKNNLL